jgi:3-methyladenine DNA glycosylase/8-oxoguanine DNA glycosylase
MLGAPSMTNEKPALPFDHVAAHEFLTRNDPHLADVVTRTGEFQFKLDQCESVYESLLEAIVYQSISGKAAAKIFSRIAALGANGICPTPAEILKTRIPALRKAGLSKAKALAMKDLAQKTIDGIVPTLEAAHGMTDEELVERLVSVRGIGPWTVEMFLIFRLGRPDVLPIHDYGVQKGWAITYRRRKIPKPKELLKFGERWRPYRTVASWYMWRAVHLAGKDARKITKPGPKSKKKKPRGAAKKSATKKPVGKKATAKKLSASATKPRRKPH